LQSSFEEEEEDDKKKISIVEPSFNASSILSSMLPAPKNSLCLAPQSNSSNAFSSRKSNLDTQLPATSTSPVDEPIQYETNQSSDPNWAGNIAQTEYVETSSTGYTMKYGNMENYVGYEGYDWSTDVAVGTSTNTSTGTSVAVRTSTSASTGTSVAMEVQDLGRARGKRGRNE
jgi:hypothetical protein